MSEIIKKRWSTISSVKMTEEAIRKLCSPPEKYRIYPNKYPSGLNLIGTIGYPHMMYVIKGCCKFKADNIEIIVNPSEYVALHKGPYEMQVFEGDDLEIVRVYELNKSD